MCFVGCFFPRGFGGLDSGLDSGWGLSFAMVLALKLVSCWECQGRPMVFAPQ